MKERNFFFYKIFSNILPVIADRYGRIPLETAGTTPGHVRTEMQYDFTIYSDDAIPSLRLIQLLIYKDPTSSKLSPIATTTSMRFTVTVAALLAALATTCFAQGVIIGSPTNGTSVSLGSNIVVQVVREVSLFTTGSGWFTTKPR